MHTIQLENVENVRDLGGLVLGDGRYFSPGIIYRGASLHNMSKSDAAVLFSSLGIDCVIDLRCGWELEDKPDIMVEQADYCHIPFYDEDIVGVAYTRKAPNTVRIGHDFACVPEDFYRSLANGRTVGQMRKAMHEVIDRVCRGGHIYQHCSGGKDRTGILSCLLLTVLGASKEQIVEDYLYTNVSRDRHRNEVYARFLLLANGDEDLADELTESHRAKEEHLECFFDEIANTYGSLEAFFVRQLGVTEELRDSFLDACCM